MDGEQTLAGAIIRIFPERRGHNSNTYQRIAFKLENGKVAMMDLCREYMNYSRWKSLLVIGKDLKNLRVKTMGGGLKVNADSFPIEVCAPGPAVKFIRTDNMTVKMVTVPSIPKEEKKEPIVQMSLFGQQAEDRPSQSDVFGNS